VYIDNWVIARIIFRKKKNPWRSTQGPEELPLYSLSTATNTAPVSSSEVLTGATRHVDKASITEKKKPLFQGFSLGT
jgi:hypothetical protein